MTTFKFGNGDNLSVTVNTNGDTYILGNGAVTRWTPPAASTT
jgi:hypothetical protein